MKFKLSAEAQESIKKQLPGEAGVREQQQSHRDLLNQRRGEEPASNEVLITRMRNTGHGMASTACPALAPMALFKETTLIKRCFPSAQCSAARLGQSDPKLSGEKQRLVEVCERQMEPFHPHLQPSTSTCLGKLPGPGQRATGKGKASAGGRAQSPGC